MDLARHGLGAALVLAFFPACAEDLAPLDPEVLAEITRTRGDAEGIELSGLYTGVFEPLECGCEDTELPVAFTLCETIDIAPISTGSMLNVEVIQADGSVRITTFPGLNNDSLGLPRVPTLYGPLMADGRVSAAGVVQADAVLLTGQFLSRVDGTLDEEGLELELQQRLAVSGNLTPILDGPRATQSVDCSERISMHLQWMAPPLLPLDPSEG